MENKIIEFDVERMLHDKEIGFIKEFSLRFPKEDICLDYNKNKLLAYLKTVDVKFLKSVTLDLSQKYQLDTKNNPFIGLVKKIEDIKSYGLKGRKRLFVGYNKERKVKNRKEKEKKRGIHYYANANNFEEKNNDCPSDFVNKILCGDSEEVLKHLPDNCIDLIFTSPPYNFGLGYSSTDDDHIWENYFNKLFAIFSECIRITKFGGRIIINVQPLFSDYIPSHHIISNFFIQKKMIWKGEILWEKNNYNCKYTAWGSWKSPSSPYLKYTWEFLEIFAKGTLKKTGQKKDIDINSDEFKKWVSAKWSIAPERNMKKYGHPAMFPEELVARAMKLFSFKNDIILDPFNGVGTTTAVARKLGRRYFGIDMSEEYVQMAKQRISATLF